MQIANTVASKAIVAVVAAAMIFSAFAAPAKAQSVEEMQKMINDLMAQIAKLQGGSTSTSTGSSSAVCPYTWTRDLRTGATGADVKKLQEFLNSNPDTRVAATGAGSAGMETENFGPATAAAVSKFQVMHRADILTPAGLTNPTGFFGPSTRAKANALCVAGATDEEDEDEEEDEEGSEELSGEATLDDATLDDAADDEIEEGAEEEVIAELTVEFTDGDASISRLDVKLGVSDATDPWDIFESVQLWVDGDMVAEMAADDEDEYQNDDETLRFTGLDIVAMEDEELEISIGATLQSSIDTNDQDNVTISVPSLRYFDAEGVATTEDDPADGDVATIDVVEAGADDELIARTSSADPDATTLQVEDDAKSDWYTVFAFDLDTDDSTNDIELNSLKLNVITDGNTASAAGYLDLVDDAELVIDGVTIDDVTVSGAGSTTEGTTVLTFDIDGDVVIDAGDRVGAELKLRFKSLAAGEEGATVRGTLSALDTTIVDAEGAETLENAQLSGSASGDVHTLRTTGINVAVDSTSAVVTTPDGNTNDYVTYTMDLEVTAFEQDVFIPVDPAVGIDYSLLDSAGAAVATGTRSVVVTSTGDENGGYFEINEGETETITIKVTYTPGAANTAARLQLLEINFRDVANTPNQTWVALPATTYRTAVVTAVN